MEDIKTANQVDSGAEYWKSLTEFPGLGRKLRITVALPNQGGCAYYRNILPYTKLAELYPNVVEVKFDENILGINVKATQKDKNPWLPNWEWETMRWADIVVTNNISNFGGAYTARMCGKTKEFGKLFHYDTDDLLTQLFDKHRLAGVYKEGLSDLTKFIYQNSDIITVTQKKFQQRIAPFLGNGLLAVVKNCIDYNLPNWKLDKTKVPKGRFVRVGWAGGIHHEEDVKEFAAIPHLVNQKVGMENVRWDFYGKPPVSPDDEKEKWQLDVWKNYEKVLAQGFGPRRNYTINWAMPSDSYGAMYANMEIAIAPLQMNDFNDSKSDIKVAECVAYGVPLIASDVGAYNETIINGKTGFLIPPGAPKSEWVRALSSVIKNRDLREEMGKNIASLRDLYDANKVIHNRLDLYKSFLEWKKNDPTIQHNNPAL